tara:strand:- start:10 stop:312 length:303 start_codon:yes stop_codon:yes gene_type:complete
MGKVDYRKLKREQIKLLGREFWQTCVAAKNTQELTRFLEGLLLPSEKVMMARRIQIAKKILQGATQSEVQSTLGVGQATVDKVEAWLQRAGPETKRLLRH